MRDGLFIDRASGFAVVIWAAMVVGLILYAAT